MGQQRNGAATGLGGLGSRESTVFTVVSVWRSLCVSEPVEEGRWMIRKDGVLLGAKSLRR